MSELSAFGITATLPAGWDGSITKRPDPAGDPAGDPEADAEAVPEVEPNAGAAPDAGTAPPPPPDAGAAPDAGQQRTMVMEGTENPVAHLANFALPAVRGDYGSGAVERMTSEDVLVCLVEFDPEAADTNLFAAEGIPQFGVNDFAPHTMQRTIAGMCGGQAFFKVSGRAFSAYVVLGSYRLRAPLVRVVNGLLAGLEIAPR
jgi:hypothetical protein